MFTASLNLEALQKAVQGPERICAAEGCDKPVAPAGQAGAEYCSDRCKQRAERPRRSRKARR
jgi:hypothetical protein